MTVFINIVLHTQGREEAFPCIKLRNSNKANQGCDPNAAVGGHGHFKGLFSTDSGAALSTSFGMTLAGKSLYSGRSGLIFRSEVLTRHLPTGG